MILLVVNSSVLTPNCFSQWVSMSNGLTWGYVYSFTISGNYLFTGLPSFGTYVTTNNGSVWTSVPGPDSKALASNGNFIYAGDRFNVYKSTDFGANWNGTGIPSAQANFQSIAVSGNYIYAGAMIGGIFLSTDNCSSWNHLTFTNSPVIAILVNGNQVLAGTAYNGVFSTTDNGATWVHTSLNTESVNALAVSENNILAGTGSGVFKSVNNGVDWTQTSLNNVAVLSLAVSGNNVFAGTLFHGIYISNDNGTTWAQRNEGFGNFQVNAMAILNGYVFAGTYGDSIYRRPIDELIGIKPISQQVPSHFSLSQNYPNPFNPSTKFKIEIAKFSFTKVSIFDVLGREVASLVNQQLQPGTYEMNWDATSEPSGVYFCKLTVGDFTETKKMILIK
jgi:hypothetical protein